MCMNCGNCKKWHCGCTTSMIAKILVIVGGINWGLMGAGMLANSSSSWNVVNILLGFSPIIEAIVYLLVGISALAMIFGCKCKKCKEGCADCKVAAPTGGSQM